MDSVADTLVPDPQDLTDDLVCVHTRVRLCARACVNGTASDKWANVTKLDCGDVVSAFSQQMW